MRTIAQQRNRIVTMSLRNYYYYKHILNRITQKLQCGNNERVPRMHTIQYTVNAQYAQDNINNSSRPWIFISTIGDKASLEYHYGNNNYV